MACGKAAVAGCEVATIQSLDDADGISKTLAAKKLMGRRAKNVEITFGRTQIWRYLHSFLIYQNAFFNDRFCWLINKMNYL